MTKARATCHCGAVELHLTMPAEGLAGAHRCDCSFCRRRGAATIGVPVDALEVVRGADKLTLYTWNTGTARHWFCSVCGIYTHHRRRSNPGEYGVNIGCIDGVNPALLEPIPWSDGVNHPSDR
ncbi:GFA family protein [Roseovarius amoyensis]|uniref:GFA family protein n=1 Tax=Roseovarius amoyensis TaxID=2211448 RepID=UPI000DBE7A65|nr:GFA family protein [Roseovarius amoyensis]